VENLPNIWNLKIIEKKNTGYDKNRTNHHG
jgi:hypothetical protein